MLEAPVRHSWARQGGPAGHRARAREDVGACPRPGAAHLRDRHQSPYGAFGRSRSCGCGRTCGAQETRVGGVDRGSHVRLGWERYHKTDMLSHHVRHAAEYTRRPERVDQGAAMMGMSEPFRMRRRSTEDQRHRIAPTTLRGQGVMGLALSIAPRSSADRTRGGSLCW